MLDNEYQQVMDTCKRKRVEIQDLQARLAESERQFNNETAKEADRIQRVQMLEAKCEVMEREIADQATKRNRAIQFVKKASKQHRQKQGKNSLTLDEADFMIRSHREISTLALKDLEKLSQTYPELIPKVQSLMEMHGIQPPSRSVSRVSSRASSVGDFASNPPSGRNSAVLEK